MIYYISIWFTYKYKTKSQKIRPLRSRIAGMFIPYETSFGIGNYASGRYYFKIMKKNNMRTRVDSNLGMTDGEKDWIQNWKMVVLSVCLAGNRCYSYFVIFPGTLFSIKQKLCKYPESYPSSYNRCDINWRTRKVPNKWTAINQMISLQIPAI